MNDPNRPRVLLHVPRYWPAIGGAELHSRELARHLRAACEVTAVRHCSVELESADVSFALGRDRVVDDDGMAVHQLAARGAGAAALRALAGVHARLRPARGLFASIARRNLRPRLSALAGDHDVVHCIYNGFTASVEAAADAAEATGRPFVFTPLAQTTHAAGTAWSSPQFRRLCARADALVALTDFERDWLVGQGARRESVHVCPMAPLLDGQPDADAFRRRHGLLGVPVVLFLGRMTHRKGLRELVRAAERVWRRHPHTRFVFVGPPSEESRALFDAHRDPRLVLTGSLSSHDKVSALAACDLLCVPSHEESLGVVYLEAWSLGRPVVALDLPVLRTVIDDGRDGLLAVAHEDDVARCISALLGDPASARAMGDAGRAKVDAHYRWERIAERMLGVYRSARAHALARSPSQNATQVGTRHAWVGHERRANDGVTAPGGTGSASAVTQSARARTWHGA